MTLERSDILFKKALECKHIKTLYDQVCNISSKSTTMWSLFLVDDKTNYCQFNACCWPAKNMILVKASLSDIEIISYFVFELFNALSEPQFKELYDLACSGNLVKFDFIQGSELIEYINMKKHRELVAKIAIEIKIELQEMNIWSFLEPKFADYWSRIKNSDHVKYWSRIYESYRKT